LHACDVTIAAASLVRIWKSLHMSTVGKYSHYFNFVGTKGDRNNCNTVFLLRKLYLGPQNYVILHFDCIPVPKPIWAC